MNLVKGNKLIELGASEFSQVLQKFHRTVIDLGTGDARFVYKNAEKNKSTLYIGVEPAYKQMVDFSKKANKNKIENVLFIIGSLDELPTELKKTADELYIILPWGSLLKSIGSPTANTVDNIKSLLKPEAFLTVIFGYSEDFEANELQRLQLESIDENKIKNELIPFYELYGFKNVGYKQVTQQELKNFESTWGKRIQQRTERKIFLLQFLYNG